MISASVADRLIAEGLISLDDAARALPVSRTSVWRWVRFGKRGVKLEACPMMGHGLWTSRQALARFSAALAVR